MWHLHQNQFPPAKSICPKYGSWLIGAIFIVTTLATPLQAALPTSGLKLRLSADVGTTLDGSSGVSVWADQSGLLNDASQTVGGSRPTLVGNTINGLPVLHFNGGQFLALPNFLAGTSAAQVFMVLRATNT